MIELYNDIHSTKVRLYASVGDLLSSGQLERSRKVLCNSKGCGCSSNMLKVVGLQSVRLKKFAAHTYEVIETNASLSENFFMDG